jgi:hypothetical protein
MDYRVILVGNGVYKKTLYRCKTSETVFLTFNKNKEANKVLFPRKYINTKGITPIGYQIYITKPTEVGDTPRTIRDKYGRLHPEAPIGNWTILHSAPYEVEETFWIFGFNPKADRPTIAEVVKRLLKGAHGKKMVKQIIVVHNKLVIYNEDHFDMVICKNILDAQRLHHTLAKVSKKQKLKNLLFMGTASKATIGRMYDLIHEVTEWPYTKIRRTTTRP